ncbi:C40 family peptidase [Dermacoccaceae bacterium W4C1]
MTDLSAPRAARVARVRVPVTVLWRSPQAPREVDAAITAATPDHGQWLHDMDARIAREENRFGLDDRIDSELVADEAVVVLDGDKEWSQVVAPWQPSREDARGYPGWVRTPHLELLPEGSGYPRIGPPAQPIPAAALLEVARGHLGQPYLWGGCSPDSIDCSGLVHRAARAHGLMVPRDAGDQEAACSPLESGQERPGDLYFFAHPGKLIHHVGFVTAPMRMLHAPGTGTAVVDEPLPQHRIDTLVAIGRLPDVDVEAEIATS